MKQVKEQLSRIPLKFPLKIKNKLKCIEDLKYEDIELIDYSPHPQLRQIWLLNKTLQYVLIGI